MSDDVPRPDTLALVDTPWPTDQNMIAWAYDPSLAHNSTTLTAGTVYLARIAIRRTVTISNLLWWITTAGATPTAGQNFVGLYGSDGTRLATAGVDATMVNTGLITTAVTAVTATPGFYWVGMVFNATTIPTIARATGSTGTGTAANAGLATAQLRFCTNATSQTSLPATITLASNSALNFAGPWVGVA